MVVVGAGAFGGWTALHLLRRGARVTLVDAWGAGNSRSSSGGETRVLRFIYGGQKKYIEWTARSLEMWKRSETEWRRKLYHRTGALWMFPGADDYARSSIGAMADAGVRALEMDGAAASRRFPQMSFEGIRAIFHEEEAGFLLAREACEAVAEAFVAEGGRYVRGAVVFPGGGLPPEGALALADGTPLAADAYVLACGPWLGRIAADLPGPPVSPTRQEVFYFGTPAGDPRFDPESLPVWIEMGDRIFYGIPGNQRRGLKVADDTRGEPFDPTSGERLPTAEGMARARAALGKRIPSLSDAPLLEARVCQYENSPDGHFVIDRHPRRADVWIAGGGSGHGFKMGPAVGAHVADLVLGLSAPDPAFSLARLSGTTGA